MKVSNSEIQTFKDCRRRWWFQYYRQLALRHESPVGPRSIGSRVHACLEEHYRPHDEAEVVDPLTFHDWLVALDVEACPEREADIRSEADLSRAMLEGYFEWLEETGADEGLTVVAAEQPVEHEAYPYRDGRTVTVMGKLDLRVRQERTDGGTVDAFLDHKTVQDFTTPTKTLHLDEQMLMYQWLVEQTGGEPVDGAIYNMLRKVKRTARAKPPFYERFTVRHSRAEVESFYVRLLGTLRDMIEVRSRLDIGDDPRSLAYPRPSRDCSWKCDFYAVCPLVDRPDLGGGEGLIDELYEVADPYRRYTDSRVEL